MLVQVSAQIVTVLLEADDFDPVDYIRNPALPQSIDILGKYYYSRQGGTPAHIVKIWVDGQLVYTSPVLYTGGANQYLETAGDWLEQHMIIPVRPRLSHGGKTPLWHWLREKGVAIGYTSEDVRKKEWLR